MYTNNKNKLQYTKTTKLIASLNEQQALDDINRIMYNSNLSEKVILDLWKDSCTGVIKKFNLTPDMPYYYHIAYMEMKKLLVNKLGENLGPMAKMPLDLLRDNLPYM